MRTARSSVIPRVSMSSALAEESDRKGGLEDAVILCLCNNVTRGDLRRIVHGGARTFEELRAAARFGNGCSMCLETIRRHAQELFAEFSKE